MRPKSSRYLNPSNGSEMVVLNKIKDPTYPRNYRLVKAETTIVSTRFGAKQGEEEAGLRFYLQGRLNWIFNLGEIAAGRGTFQARRVAVNTSALNSKIVIPSAKPIACRHCQRDSRGIFSPRFFIILFFPFFFPPRRFVRFVSFLSRKNIISYYFLSFYRRAHIYARARG